MDVFSCVAYGALIWLTDSTSAIPCVTCFCTLNKQTSHVESVNWTSILIRLMTSQDGYIANLYQPRHLYSLRISVLLGTMNYNILHQVSRVSPKENILCAVCLFSRFVSGRYESVPILALSGTAPPLRQSHIQQSLGLRNALRCSVWNHMCFLPFFGCHLLFWMNDIERCLLKRLFWVYS